MIKKKTKELEQLLTPDDVEERWQLCKSSQAALRSRGLIPFVLLAPRTPRYRMSELQSWLAAKGLA